MLREIAFQLMSSYETKKGPLAAQKKHSNPKAKFQI